MKKAIFAVIILSMMFLSACSQQFDNEPDINIPPFDLKFGGNWQCGTDWNEVLASQELSNLQKRNIDWFVEESFREEGVVDCINNQKTSKCLLLYAMINNQPEICNYFPEEEEVTYWGPPSMGSGEGEGYSNMTCRYQEICKAYVTLRNIE